MDTPSPPPFPVTPGTVYFIGAGPGTPDLMTIRARDIIAQSDLVLYADSLVDSRVGTFARPGAEVVGSREMHLDEIVAQMVRVAQRGGVVARVHSGDPAIYGAIHEQMVRLDAAGVPYEIVPGVSTVFAAAARLKVELTVPGVVQTVILTRTAGRTSVPEGERLADLARTGASLAIFLSVTRIQQVVRDLLAGGRFTRETPVAVLHRVSWPDESCVLGTLGDISEKVRAAGYTRQALILVSPALDPALRAMPNHTSNLYDAGYTHRFRRSVIPAHSAAPSRAGSQETGGPSREGTAIVAVTRAAGQLAQRLATALDASAYLPSKHAGDGAATQLYEGSVLTVIRELWPRVARLVLLMPIGLAVRAIGPLPHDKSNDPSVVVADEQGRHVVATLGGHIAGANELARQIAALTRGQAILTTASDVQGRPALDLWIREHDLVPGNPERLTAVMAALVNGETIGSVAAPEWQKRLAPFEMLPVTLDELMTGSYSAGLIISDRLVGAAYAPLLARTLLLHPRSLVVGIGCRRGTSAGEIEAAISATLAGAGLAESSVAALATATLKADEAGLRSVAERRGWPLHCYEADAINAAEIDGTLSPSAATARFGLHGVAEPCALLASGAAELLVPKRTFTRVTVAVARRRNAPQVVVA
ncbi:MAG: precorrin-4 C(11)-methyltransferase [Ardenticatenaceae bacterium]|nr:precorrin-4 C(11)-methyltransferase [Ardenticatenaceae bacterium]